MRINAREQSVRAAAAALGRAALFDDTITADDDARVAAFAEAFDPFGITVELAIAAVTAHYQGEGVRSPKPGDLIAHARRIRADQAQRAQADPVARGEHERALDTVHGLTSPDAQLGGLPIAGAVGPPIPDAYALGGALDRECPQCRADAGVACTDHASGKPRRIPCLSRTTPSVPPSTRSLERKPPRRSA